MIRCACGSRNVKVRGMCPACYQRDYRATHPEFRERERANCREYMRARAARVRPPVPAAGYGAELVRVPVKGWGCL
jgi:NMD protein affecting ribosome stability and mRNA decay